MSGESVIPESYEQWRHCIEVRCRIQLTPTFVEARLKELQDATNPRTKEFKKMYGADHLQRTVSWYRQAAGEVSRAR